MNFLRWLFGSKQSPQNQEITRVKNPDTFVIDIVGESNYQDNLEMICGKRKKEGEQKIVTALLILENNNPKDNQAVRVDIQDMTVGYLSKEEARTFRKALKLSSTKTDTIECQAMIVGGWKRTNSIGHYGVKLAYPK